MFPEGTKPLPVPKGMGVIKVGNDIFHYRPAEIKANEIRTAAREGRLNDVLDLGPLSKDDVLQRAAAGEPPVAITERTPDGTEVKASAATAPTADIQAAHLEATKTPGNTVQAEHPDRVIAERQAERELTLGEALGLPHPEAPDSAEALARKITGKGRV